MQNNVFKIPKLFSWLIDWFTSDADIFHLKGDYEEIYDRICRNSSRFRANRWILKQIIVSAYLSLDDTLVWSMAMIKNYLKVAFRNIIRHKVLSAINILGLAIGIACTVLILQWVQHELSYDRFHENAENLYVATFSNGSPVTPSALAGFLKSEYPEILNTSRLTYGGRNLLTVRETKTMEDGCIMTDPAFLEMFTIPFLRGNPQTALNDPYSIIISQRIAEKYFGTEDALYKTITYGVSTDLKVTGIFQNYPENSHMVFEYILPIAFLKEEGHNINTWDWNNLWTYVQLRDQVPVASVDVKISNVVENHRPQDQRALSLQPITRLHLYRFNTNSGPIIYVYLFSAMAFFILLIACINFMNLTTAHSTIRAKEVGIRKTVGAGKTDLIRQFFTESVLLTLFSLFIGIVIIILFLPSFNTLTGKQFTVRLLSRQAGILGIFGITLFTGIVAGSYPALFLSRFQPIKVLKGTLTAGNKGALFRKVLVVLQFTVSIFLIFMTLMIYSQVIYLRGMDLGFNKENIVYFDIGSRFRQNMETVKTGLRANPNIRAVTLVNVAPYCFITNAGYGDVHWEGKTGQQVKMVMTSVDYDYLDVFGLKMSRGRFFSKEYMTDVSDGYVVNEAAVKAMEMDDPIGKELTIWELKGRIVGVIQDYHFESLRSKIVPMAMRIQPDNYYQACVRIRPGDVPATLAFLEKKWHEIYPEYPFEYRFLDDAIDSRYRSEERIGKIVTHFTILAILISSLGLFGLASFAAERRTKEIGIRKVCGATVMGLLLLLSKDFLRLVLFAWILAIPAAYYLMDKWLSVYAYRVPLNIFVILFAGMVSIIVSIFTVSYHTLKAARANPVQALRYE